MAWANRPDIKPEEQLLELEKTFGIENLKNVDVINESGSYYLQIYAQNKKFRVQLTEV